MNETIDEAFLDREIERAKSVVASWDQWALACRVIEGERMHSSDIAKFEVARTRVKDAFSQFAERVDAIRSINPVLAANLYGLTVVMMDASMTMGGIALYAPSARQAFTAPLVKKIRKQRSGAGKASGISRRANRPWVKEATNLAIEIGKQDLALSQDDIATETIAGWKNHEVKPPGHTTIKIHVAGLIRDGKIPARSRPKRSRK